MDIYEAIRKRKSIRKYKSEPVSDEKLTKVLEAARLAPSGKNGQPWRFIIVRDEKIRKELIPACRGQAFVAEAPIIVAACGREQDSYQKQGGYMTSMAIDIGITLEHLMLAAAAEGLGTCWIGAFEEKEVKKVLGIPDDLRVVALTPLGYPDQEPSPKPRKTYQK